MMNTSLTACFRVGNASDYVFTQWSPLPDSITQDMDCCAQYQFVGTYFRQYLTDTLTSYVDTDGITTIGDYAFAGLSNLVSISMPSLTAVSESGFRAASSLSEVSLPAVLATNGNAFTNNGALEVLYLPELTLLNSSPLVANMTALKEVRLPKNTSSMASMFSVCTNLELIDAGVTATLGQNLTITHFSKLKTLILRNATTVVTPVNSAIFNASSPIAKGTGKILVPSGMVASYKADSNWGAFSDVIEAIEDNPDIANYAG